jgi:hypothetical protein
MPLTHIDVPQIAIVALIIAQQAPKIGVIERPLIDLS